VPDQMFGWAKMPRWFFMAGQFSIDAKPVGDDPVSESGHRLIRSDRQVSFRGTAADLAAFRICSFRS
jgi:hypothetical protein